jgi:hypothetical protein
MMTGVWFSVLGIMLRHFGNLFPASSEKELQTLTGGLTPRRSYALSKYEPEWS